MKTTWIVIAGLCVTIPAALAQSGPQNQQQKKFGDGACLPTYLAHYDVNKDGVIDEEESQVMDQARDQIRKKLRTDWDTNGDGKISDQERDQARTRLCAMITENRETRFLEAESDTDSDEALSYEEFVLLPGMAKKLAEKPEVVAAIFDRLDTNDDQAVSLEEFLAAVKQCDQARDGSGTGSGGSGNGK